MLEVALSESVVDLFGVKVAIEHDYGFDWSHADVGEDGIESVRRCCTLKWAAESSDSVLDQYETKVLTELETTMN